MLRTRRSKPKPDSDEELSPAERLNLARQSAIGLLARREHSRRELAHKLSLRGYDDTLIGQLLDELAAENLQSEQRFAESYIYGRQQRGYGPQRIRAELRERGLTDSLIEAELAAAGVDWFERAREAWGKRFGQPAGDIQEKARQSRFLLNRGFSHDQIQYALEAGRTSGQTE